MRSCILIVVAALVVTFHAALPAYAQHKKNQPHPKRHRAVIAVKKPTMPGNVEVKVGINMAYDWWHPGFMRLENGMTGNIVSNSLRMRHGGSFMMGPMLWIKANSKWNIGLSALFGLARDKFKYTTLGLDNSFLYLTIPQIMTSAFIEDGKMKSRRYQVDATVEYFFHKYFNLLFGVKFKYNDGEGKSMRLMAFPTLLTVGKSDLEYNAWYVGPSLGVGLYYEVKGFSIKAAMAALIQGGTYYSRKQFLCPRNPLLLFYFIPDEFAVAYLAMGGTADLKLAYFVEKIRVEFWVGGYYAILPHINLFDVGSAYNGSYLKGWITGEYEQYYGINFGAAYKF